MNTPPREYSQDAIGSKAWFEVELLENDDNAVVTFAPSERLTGKVQLVCYAGPCAPAGAPKACTSVGGNCASVDASFVPAPGVEQELPADRLPDGKIFVGLINAPDDLLCRVVVHTTPK